MDVITPLNPGTLATIGGHWYGLPSFLAQGPFSSIAKAAITRPAAPATSAGGTPAIPSSSGTSENHVAHAATPAPPTTASSGSSGATPAQQEYATVSGPEGGGPAGQSTDTSMADAVQDATATAGAAPAANVASLAANELYEADAASQLAQGSGSLATDAAARFMGAGQQSGLGPNQSEAAAAYEEALKAIPAISWVVSSHGLAANTSSPQGKPFTHLAGQIAPLVQAGKSFPSSLLNLLA